MEIREDGTVCRLIDPFIKEQDQGRQQGDTNDNSDDNSFCHNDSKVASQSKCHKTVVMELPTTDLNVLLIACAIARSLSLSKRTLFA